jgi:hypothetical protein
LGDRGFRSIVLNPDFAVFDVEVKDEAENTFLGFPPNVGELVMVMFAITNNLSLYIIGMAVGMGLFCEYLPDYLPILLQLIHTLIFSCDRHSIKTARDYDLILAQVRQWMSIAPVFDRTLIPASRSIAPLMSSIDWMGSIAWARFDQYSAQDKASSDKLSSV